MKPTGWILAALAALLLALAGCAERQGSKGKTGPAGPAGTPAASVIQESLTFSVQSASVPADGKPVVVFKLLDQDGLAYSKLTLGSTTSANLRVTIAKLVAATSSQPSYWESYLNTTSTKTNAKVGYWPSGVSTRSSTQPSQEGSSAYAAGTLTYDSSTQAYTYKFNTAITAISSPVTVTYSASATHRIGLELRNLTTAEDEVLGADGVFDFVPSGGTPSTRAIVSTSTCNNACHGKLEAHGEARFSVEYCVLCHNARIADPNGGDIYNIANGNPLDMRIMVHRLHMGKLLPSNIDASATDSDFADYKNYRVWGFNETLADFGYGTFPIFTTSRGSSDKLTLRTTGYPSATPVFFPDCVKCHVEGTGAPAQAANWKDNPTIQTCTSCHNNIYFGAAAPTTAPTNYQAAMKQHGGFSSSGALTDNSTCGGCHASGMASATDTAHNYAKLIREAADRWTFNIVGVQYNPGATSSNMIVTYRVDETVSGVTTQGVDISQAAYSSGASSPFGCGSTCTFNIKVAWPGFEHVNNGLASQSAAASGVSASLTSGLPAGLGTVTCSGSPSVCTIAKTFTVPNTAINDVAYETSAGFTSIAVFIDGHPGASVNSGVNNSAIVRGVPAQSTIEYFEVANAGGLAAGTLLSKTDTANAGKIRRKAVDSATRCQNCHTTLAFHGANRSDDAQVCVACHNPNNTDIARRPTGGIDSKREESLDFKYMIHAVHAGGKSSPDSTVTAAFNGKRETGYVAYGFSGPSDFTSTAFPNRLNNCEVCHLPGAYELPLNELANPRTVKTMPAVTLDFEATPHSVPLATGLVTGTGVFSVANQRTATLVSTDGTLPIRISVSGSGSAFPTVSAGAALSTTADYLLCDMTNAATTTYTFTLARSGDGCGAPMTYSAAGTGTFNVMPRDLTDPSDDKNVSSTAAVCTACHDDALAKQHMVETGRAAIDGTTASGSNAFPNGITDGEYDTAQGNYTQGYELCVLCHGPGTIADVKKVHRAGQP